MEVYVLIEQNDDFTQVVGVFQDQDDAYRAMQNHENSDDCYILVDVLQ
mgnify:FL=1